MSISHENSWSVSLPGLISPIRLEIMHNLIDIYILIYIYIYMLLIYSYIYVIPAWVLCLIYTPRACAYITSACGIYKCYTLPMLADSPPVLSGNQDLLYRPLGKIRLWACTCKQEPPLYLRLSTKNGRVLWKAWKALISD